MPKRRIPVQARARAKVERILQAARQTLVEEGPDRFNTNRIAQRAGVGVGSLYEYFPDKQAIIRRLIDELADAEGEAVLALFAELGDAPLERIIDRAVELVCQLYQQNSDLYRLLWAISSDAREVGSRPLEREIVREMKRQLEARADQLAVEDLELACFTSFHLVEALAARMAEQSASWDLSTQAREIARVVKRYLGIGS